MSPIIAHGLKAGDIVCVKASLAVQYYNLVGVAAADCLRPPSFNDVTSLTSSRYVHQVQSHGKHVQY